MIEGDYIGVAVDGLSPLGNGNDGVYVELNASQNTIGGPQALAQNVISDNGRMFARNKGGGFGVSLYGTQNLVQNNIIGLDKNGQDPNGNMWNAGGWWDDQGAMNVWQNNQHQNP